MFLAFNIQLLHFLTNGKRYNFIILRISNAMMNLCYKVHTTCNIKRIRLVAEKRKSASLVGCNIKFETFFCFILTQRRNPKDLSYPSLKSIWIIFQIVFYTNAGLNSLSQIITQNFVQRISCIFSFQAFS